MDVVIFDSYLRVTYTNLSRFTKNKDIRNIINFDTLLIDTKKSNHIDNFFKNAHKTIISTDLENFDMLVNIYFFLVEKLNKKFE